MEEGALLFSHFIIRRIENYREMIKDLFHKEKYLINVTKIRHHLWRLKRTLLDIAEREGFYNESAQNPYEIYKQIIGELSSPTLKGAAHTMEKSYNFYTTNQKLEAKRIVMSYYPSSKQTITYIKKDKEEKAYLRYPDISRVPLSISQMFSYLMSVAEEMHSFLPFSIRRKICKYVARYTLKHGLTYEEGEKIATIMFEYASSIHPSNLKDLTRIIGKEREAEKFIAYLERIIHDFPLAEKNEAIVPLDTFVSQTSYDMESAWEMIKEMIDYPYDQDNLW